MGEFLNLVPFAHRAGSPESDDAEGLKGRPFALRPTGKTSCISAVSGLISKHMEKTHDCNRRTISS